MHLSKRPRIGQSTDNFKPEIKKEFENKTMLFITNKLSYDSILKEVESVVTQKQVHQKAYHLLTTQMIVHNSIPLVIMFELENIDFTFTFESKRGNVFYYEFNGLMK